jgi:DHA1 family inner membrane transport protein
VGWQAAFIGIVILGVIALASTLVFVPSVEGRGTGGFAAQAPAAFAPRVLAMLGIGFLLMGGEFTAFTYLVSYLEEVTGISGGLVTGFLLAFGIAAAVGTFLGGRAADRSATTTLVVCNVLLILTLGALYLVGSTPVLVALALAVGGLLDSGWPLPCSCVYSVFREPDFSLKRKRILRLALLLTEQATGLAAI